jgi:hypothetical protein
MKRPQRDVAQRVPQRAPQSRGAGPETAGPGIGNRAAGEREIKSLTASLKEQASQIQKVSAQLEVTKPAPQLVSNNQ